MGDIKENAIHDIAVESQNDVTVISQIDGDAKENVIRDIAIESQIDNDATGNIIHDIAVENQIDDIAVESQIDNNAVENRIDDGAAENKIDDGAAENKIDDGAAENKIDDTAVENKIDDTAVENDDTAAGNEIVDDTAVENKIDDTAVENKIDGTAAGNEIVDDTAENEIDDTVVENQVYDDIFERSHCFIHTISRYLTKCYDDFNRKSTGIEEVHLPRDCKIILKGSISRYKSTDFFEKFLSFSGRENRYEELKAEFQEQLTAKGNSLPHSEFLRLSALYILTAIDLKEKAEFDEAPDAAVEAITDTIIATKQQGWMNLWY